MGAYVRTHNIRTMLYVVDDNKSVKISVLRIADHIREQKYLRLALVILAILFIFFFFFFFFFSFPAFNPISLCLLRNCTCCNTEMNLKLSASSRRLVSYP
ncbi:hypothetical protein ACN38_g12414 [Penicillium nordicum]|uniref:Uncharacterized protein n=1 Tax=Penicillium nordicum TaxID=229535 RepID=A0A0M9W9V6_9EURO|nr:hypothetical protein ACN38_g12414 [Penicillium nordicum]